MKGFIFPNNERSPIRRIHAVRSHFRPIIPCATSYYLQKGRQLYQGSDGLCHATFGLLSRNRALQIIQDIVYDVIICLRTFGFTIHCYRISGSPSVIIGSIKRNVKHRNNNETDEHNDTKLLKHWTQLQPQNTTRHMASSEREHFSVWKLKNHLEVMKNYSIQITCLSSQCYKRSK